MKAWLGFLIYLGIDETDATPEFDWIFLGSVIGSLFAILVIFVICACVCTKHKKKSKPISGGKKFGQSRL